MKVQINPNAAILFLLQKEYIRESKVVPIKNEDGSPQLTPDGKEQFRAEHPEGLTFPDWLSLHKLAVPESPIIQQNGQPINTGQPLQIIKP